MNNPVVAIFCVTYNHQEYVSKCVESVMAQVTAFDFVMIINDDCSTDKTAEICLGLKKRYPEKIVFSRNETNLGMNPNIFLTFEKCLNTKSKYIALISGDDYWIDPDKLQNQYDFMEANPDVAFCYTNAYSFYDDNNSDKEIAIKENPTQSIFDLEYYVNNNCFIIPAQTVFFRNAVFPIPIPVFLLDAFSSDWALNILLLEKGKAAYLDEITAMYRVHAGGITSSTYGPTIIHNGIYLAKSLDKYFKYKYHSVFGKIHWRYRLLVVYYFEKKKYLKGFYWLFFCFFYNPFLFITNIYFLKTLFKVTFTSHEV